MNVRMAEWEDMEAIACLWECLVKEGKEGENPRKELWLKVQKMIFDSPYYSCLIAEEDGEIVGFLDGFVHLEPTTDMIHAVGKHFYVKPAYRGRASRMLFRYALSLGISKGAMVFDVFTTPEIAEFWKKHNFNQNQVLLRRYIQ